MADRPLTVSQAVELIGGISRATLYRYIDRGVISAEPAPNGQKRIRESEALRLKAWLEGTDTDGPE